MFQKLRAELGWTARGAYAQARIHDLRHTFICRRVQLWHEHGADIDNAMAALSTYVGHAKVSDTYWYLTGVPDLMAIAGERFEQSSRPPSERVTMADPISTPSFSILLQRFFVEHLGRQRAVSPRTIAAYRDTFRLLLSFAEARIGKAPTALALADLDAQLILTFLDHLEKDRKNGARSRNARLAALRSFLKYAAHHDLTALPVIEQALAIPMKRFDRPVLGFLSRQEMQAILAACRTEGCG